MGITCLPEAEVFYDRTHEWQRTHHVEQFDQVDSRAYLVHPWMNYQKFGHASATDYAARFVDDGSITREEAKQLVKEHDHKLDVKAMRDFCAFLGYAESQFWAILQDKFYNPELFEKKNLGRMDIEGSCMGTLIPWDPFCLPRRW